MGSRLHKHVMPAARILSGGSSLHATKSLGHVYNARRITLRAVHRSTGGPLKLKKERSIQIKGTVRCTSRKPLTCSSTSSSVNRDSGFLMTKARGTDAAASPSSCPTEDAGTPVTPTCTTLLQLRTKSSISDGAT